MESQIDNFYIRCMNCKNPQCKGMWNDIENGIPPRGFYYINNSIDILVVAKNPGHPFEDEITKYKGLSGIELFKAYRSRQNDFYYNLSKFKERSSTFHKNLFRYLSYFLDIANNPLDIYQRVAHTNLVKCSTYDEQEVLKKETIQNCFNTHFKMEVEYFKPKVILALGREVERYLSKNIKIPVVGIKHPSYFYRKEDEKEILESIKREIEIHLTTAST